MRTFRLPDLGEGLHEAEIVAWHVGAGQDVTADAPLVSVETDKAVTEVPAPWTGRITRLCAAVGERIAVGASVVEYEGDEGMATEGDAVTLPSAAVVAAHPGAASLAPPGTPARAMPAVRLLARELGLDLDRITGTGPAGAILVRDVAAAFRASSPASLSVAAPGTPTAPDPGWEPLRGARRSMADAMARSRAEVASATVHEDCDVGAWAAGQIVMLRLVRALCRAAKAEPAVNAWFDPPRGRKLHDSVDVGIAVDTSDGLIVPVLRGADRMDASRFRKELERLVSGARARSLPAEDLRGATITLSNFGSIAGTFATPVIVPPQVAILGAGRIRAVAVPIDGRLESRPMLPLSLTCDHRVVTGGEAARFLKAVVADLLLPL